MLYAKTLCKCHSGAQFGLRFVLADFGLARNLATGTEGKPGITSGKYGSRSYRAPELSLQGEFSTGTDIWAIGCLLVYVATTGVHNIFTDDLAAANYAKGVPGFMRPLSPEDNSLLREKDLEELNTVLKGCLEIDANHRFGAGDLLQRFEKLTMSEIS